MTVRTSPRGRGSLKGGGSSDISLFRRCGNYGLNKTVNLLYGTKYSDLCYGYNAFWRHCLEIVCLDCSKPSESDGISMQWGDGFERLRR